MFQPEKRIGLLGTPFMKGQRKEGVECGPKLFRMKNVIEEIEKYGLNVHDFGDIESVRIPNDKNIFMAKYPRTFNQNALNVAKKIKEIINKNYIPLTIGGDHSMSVGTILGHSEIRKDICVVWVDAHADIHTPMSSPTGNMHGMPLGFLVEEMQNEMPWIEEFKSLRPAIPAANLVYIGLRDVDPYERFVLNKYKIKSFSMNDVDKYGIDWVIQDAIKTVNPDLKKSIHLSFDIDSLDPLYAPSTGTVVPGGLSLREGIYICEQLFHTGQLAAIDIAEVNAQLGTHTNATTTLESGIKIILACLGIGREGDPTIDPGYYSWKDSCPSRSSY